MTLIALTALALFGLGVALGLRAILLPRIEVAERMVQVDVYGYVAKEPATGETERVSGLAALATRIGAALMRRYPDRFDEDEIRYNLTAAGMYGTEPLTFLGARVLAAAGMGGFLMFLALAGGGALLVIAAMIAGILGWRLPNVVLERRGKERLVQIDRDMPELVDLLIVTVEAGVGFNASLQLAGGRMSGPLGDELRLSMQEQRMGLSTSESLAKMMARVDTPSMRSFVRSILQGEQLGVSIGQILRNLASEMRKRRRAAAEERAQKAPIKLLFPLVFLIFPSLFIVLLYPAVAEIMKVLG